MEGGSGVSARDRVFLHDQILVFTCPSAVLPKPGFRWHLPGDEKSGLGWDGARGCLAGFEVALKQAADLRRGPQVNRAADHVGRFTPGGDPTRLTD